MICRKLFHCGEVVELGRISSETINTVVGSDRVYCVHRERDEDEVRQMKYYFNEVVEVVGNVRYMNKSRRVVKHYLVRKNADGVVDDLVEIKEVSEREESVDKTGFLPHLRAQDSEVVVFPDDEE